MTENERVAARAVGSVLLLMSLKWGIIIAAVKAAKKLDQRVT